jgi:hypothetical protein
MRAFVKDLTNIIPERFGSIGPVVSEVLIKMYKSLDHEYLDEDPIR